jgi:glutamate synthase domain-containing protein 3
MYDISDGKTAVWMGGGFSYYMDLKSDIELKLKNTIIEFKKVELENKLVKIGEDF